MTDNEWRNKNQLRTDIHPLTCPDHSNLWLVAVGKVWRCAHRGCDYAQRIGGTPEPPPQPVSGDRSPIRDVIIEALHQLPYPVPTGKEDVNANALAIHNAIDASGRLEPQPVSDQECDGTGSALRSAAKAVRDRWLKETKKSPGGLDAAWVFVFAYDAIYPHWPADRSTALVAKLRRLFMAPPKPHEHATRRQIGWHEGVDGITAQGRAILADFEKGGA